LGLQDKLRFGRFVVEQKSKQNYNALAYSKCMANSICLLQVPMSQWGSKILGIDCIEARVGYLSIS